MSEQAFSFLEQAVHQLNLGHNESAQAAALVVIATELVEVRRELAKTRNEMALLIDQTAVLKQRLQLG